MISNRPSRKCIWIFNIIIPILSCSSLTSGQEQSQYDKGTPPQHAAGVSPLGSYTSTDLGSVNLSNGALNFKIPLATVGGRGFSIPLTLNYSSKVWSASMDTAEDNNNNPFQAAYADYANIDGFVDFFQRLGPGWTIGATPMIFNRIVRIGKLPPGGPNGGCYTFTLPKLTVMLPDKGEIEFRDDLYEGAPLPSDCGGWISTTRGTRWHATDGSGTIYISDVDNAAAQQFGDLSGVVITADGTRYRFNGPRCSSITDRNGNRIDITYSTSPSKVEYKDQLARITKIEQFVPDPDNPSVTLAALVTIPGYGGNRYIKLKRAVMSANYRSDNTPPGQVCNGTYDPLSKGYSTWCGSNPTVLFPHSYGLFLQRIDNQQVLTEVVLPDQRSLRFRYNVFGEVAESQLPTGGKIWYDYEEGSVPAGNSPLWEIGGGFHTEVGEVDRTVVQRRVFDGSTLLATWDYFYSTSDVFVTAKSPTQEVLLNQRHRFLESLRYDEYVSSLEPHDGTYYSKWSTGVEWRTETLNAAGTTVLTAVEKDWDQRTAVAWSTYPQEQPANDNRVNQERRYLENGMMAKTVTLYDQHNNPTEVKEYAFDQTLKRRTVTSYLSSHNGVNYQTDDSIHLLSLPVTTTVFNGDTPVAETTNEYDVYTDDGNHGLLTAYGSVSQHDSNYGVSKTTRGNLTKIGHWLNTSGTFIYAYPRFDVLGNVVSTKDANGKVTTVSFADDFGPGQNPGSPTQNPATPTYALPTLITSPPPLSGALVHTARSQYDYATGLLTGFRDRNNIVTQTIYDDPFNRPTQVKAALGVTGVETHVSNYYAPATVFGITLAKNDVLTVSDLNNIDDASIRSWTVTDGFGRPTETWKRDPQGDVKVITVYDGLSRVEQTSNPFRPATESAVYTTTVYDLVGRVTSVKTPDNAVVSTSYNGNSATVTDQAGKKRKSVTDALGRLLEVYEDPEIPGGPAELNFQTTYLYDTLDNLVKVTQGSQQRFFMYDSLKRLIRARNPEQGTLGSLNLSDPITSNSAWSVGYEYDANGNLIKKTDARGVESIYAYDALNRNTEINYTDTLSITPDVKWFYDGATNGKGRFWHFYKGGDFTAGQEVEHTSVDSYDALGRPLVKRQLFKSGGVWSTATYQIERTYNRAGGVTWQKYPSQHSVTYNYDVAGRLADKDALNLAFTGNLGDGVPRTYARDINYSSWGSLSRERFGTNAAVYNKLRYNIRGQLCDVRASNSGDEWGGELGALVNYYSTTWAHCGSGADNNGNLLMSQTIINSYSMEDRYEYDQLNRLTAVNEWQNGSTHTGRQQYDYDRWGNRTINATGTWIGNSNNPPNPLLNEMQFDGGALASTNRLYAPGDLGLPDNQRRMRYDAAGNLTTDTYTGAGERVYDAENRMTTAWGGNNEWQYYTYNADGQRVRRKINNQETWQVYGFNGELLAEYSANGAVGSPQKEYGYRNGQLLITAEAGSGGGGTTANVASAANGATASASSNYGGQPLTANAINGDHVGSNSWWADNTSSGYPDWLQVDFAGSKTINEIDVFGLQQNYSNPVEPTLTMTSSYALTDFEVQYWNGSAWAAVPGGSVTGNDKVWRKFTFAPLTTSKIRVNVTNVAGDNHSQVVEVEAYQVPAVAVNVAQASNGATASASSNYGGQPLTANAINGDHVGSNSWWADNTSSGYPDWLQVDFAGSKTINEIDVFGLQQNYSNPVEPTLTMTSSYALTDFEVQYWNGSAWAAVPGGSVTGNDKVWRKFTFAPLTTSKIRVNITNVAGDNHSQVVEIEAYAASSAASIQWLVTDHLGTPRMIIDQTGTLENIKRHDYLPFGEELFAPTGGRTAALGYASGDGVRQQFTGQERDIETGLDFFEARYFSSIQGRFTSTDPLMASARVINPKTWNRYSYVLNNPLKLVDPSGLSAQDPQPHPTPTPVPPGESSSNPIWAIFEFLFGDYYQDPGDAGDASQAFRDPLAMLINPGTVGAKFEVGAADTNLVTGILRGATPAEMGVPSGMRLVITPMVRLELLNHGAVTPEALDVALDRANIEVREIAQDLRVAALKEITPLYSKGQLSDDFVKAINQMSDLHILAEAKAAGLPLLTNNINDFNVSAIGGGKLAQRVGVPVIETKVVPKHLPKLGDVMKGIIRKLF